MSAMDPLVPQLPSLGSLSASSDIVGGKLKLVHTVRSTRISISHYFIHVYYCTFYTVLRLILSDELNSTSTFATSMSPKGCTVPNRRREMLASLSSTQYVTTLPIHSHT